MALTKAKLFSDKQIRTSELAKALSHPARVAIVEILSQSDTCICGDITGQLPLAQSTVSQHLKALKASGLIKGEVEGVKTCYCLNEEVVKEMKKLFDEMIHQLNQSNPNEPCC